MGGKGRRLQDMDMDDMGSMGSMEDEDPMMDMIGEMATGMCMCKCEAMMSMKDELMNEDDEDVAEDDEDMTEVDVETEEDEAGVDYRRRLQGKNRNKNKGNKDGAEGGDESGDDEEGGD